MNASRRSISKKISVQPRDGFTLIELFVVLATVAVLAAMLLPVLASTKPDSQAFQCMNNHKQLILAWQMYAADNSDLLPPNDYPYLTAYATAPAGTTPANGNRLGMKNWVVGTMASAFDASTLNQSELVDPNSLLSRYLTNAAVYRCPADNYIEVNTTHTVHTRSYSMNSAVGTTWNSFYASGTPTLGAPVQGGWLTGFYNGSQTTWLTYGKLSSFTRPGPANTFIIMDESPILISDSSLNICATATAGHTFLIDFPAGNHNGAAGMSFADGHVIIHKWLDVRTYSPNPALHGIQYGGPGLVTPDDPDMFYLAPLTSALR
jgi:prepilin-type N-terminal cleavage/methylation domain-containing protein/prepilin-type processing-associated H-X9-DG protein